MFVPLLLLWHHHTFFHVGKEIPWRPDNKGLNFQGTVSVSPLDLFDTLFHQTRIHWVQINSQPSKEIFWKDCLWLALMKYTLENLHFNHIWSSAFQKWFCLTTSDLSLREVSFRRMPAFKSQVNRTQTNFPGGCNKPARHLTRSRLSSALHQVRLPAVCKGGRCCMCIRHHQFTTESSGFIKTSSLHLACWENLGLDSPLDTSLQILILCLSQSLLCLIALVILGHTESLCLFYS